MPDFSKIDTSSTIGQVALLIIALAFLASNLKGVFDGAKKTVKNRSLVSMDEELRTYKRELGYTRSINRDLVDHQLTAKETIRSLRLLLIDAGGKIDERTNELFETLKEIEQRSQEGAEDDD